jgi:hypothetical protein
MLERVAAAEGAAGGVSDDEVAEGLQRRLTALEEYRPAEWAAFGAFETLDGRRVRTPEERRDEERAVTAEEVRRVAADACREVLAVVPSGVRVPDDWAPARAASHEPVQGRSYAWRGEGDGVLQFGPAGLTRRSGAQTATVIFDHVQAVVRLPDGYRELIGDDAVSVTIEPTLWVGGPSLVSLVDAEFEGAAAERFIDLPPRPASEIPTPHQADAGAAPAQVPVVPPSRGKFFLTSFFVSMGVLLMVILVFALTGLSDTLFVPAMLVFVGGTVSTMSSMWKDRRRAYDEWLAERA